MRLGLDLRAVTDADRRAALAVEADRLGLWAVLVGGSDGTGAVEAAALATATEHLHLGVWFDASVDHPTVVAEEVAVLDHLSRRRALAVVAGPDTAVVLVARLLAGHAVDGVVLTPPPAQTQVPVWAAHDEQAQPVPLTGDLDRDRATVDRLRDGGATHRFVALAGGPNPDPRSLASVARHLASRAAEPAFPRIVADLADVIDPLP